MKRPTAHLVVALVPGVAVSRRHDQVVGDDDASAAVLVTPAIGDLYLRLRSENKHKHRKIKPIERAIREQTEKSPLESVSQLRIVTNNYNVL